MDRSLSKEVTRSQSTIETYVAMASLDFKYGASGFSKLTAEMNIEPGTHITLQVYQQRRCWPMMAVIGTITDDIRMNIKNNTWMILE